MACTSCHGGGLESAGAPGPDLRESAIAMDENAMWSVLHDGALLPHGMPRFPNLTRDQVHQLYSYVRVGARKEIERQRSGGARNKGEAHGSTTSGAAGLPEPDTGRQTMPEH
jgi:quinohemoprotein ethanol dehydrogenase